MLSPELRNNEDVVVIMHLLLGVNNTDLKAIPERLSVYPKR